MLMKKILLLVLVAFGLGLQAQGYDFSLIPESFVYEYTPNPTTISWSVSGSAPTHGMTEDLVIEDIKGTCARFETGSTAPVTNKNGARLILLGPGKFRLMYRKWYTDKQEYRNMLLQTIEIKTSLTFTLEGQDTLKTDWSSAGYNIRPVGGEIPNRIKRVEWSVMGDPIIKFLENENNSRLVVKPIKVGIQWLNAMVYSNFDEAPISLSKRIYVVHGLKIEADKSLLCSDEIVTARITTAVPEGREPVWSSPDLILQSGQGDKVAEFKPKGGFNGYTSIQVKVGDIIRNIENIWVGPPKVKNSRFTYTSPNRDPLTLNAHLEQFEGPSDKNGVWAFEKGVSKYEILSQNNDSLSIVSRMKATEGGQIVFRYTVNNKCGEVSTYHTIDVLKMKGSSFDDPIDIGQIAITGYGSINSPILPTEPYDNKEFYAKLNVLDAYSSLNVSLTAEGSKEDKIHIYDSNRQLFTILNGSANNSFMLPTGVYYIVAKATNENKKMGLHIAYRPGGTTSEYAIDLGSLDDDFTFSDAKNTLAEIYYPYRMKSSYDDIQTSRAIYYKFTLKKPMHVRINNLGSQLYTGAFLVKANADGTLDESQPEIAHFVTSFSQYFPLATIASSTYFNAYYSPQEGDLSEEPLPAGTYYVISEPLKPHLLYGQLWGLVVTTIEGFSTMPPYFDLRAVEGNTLSSSTNINISKMQVLNEIATYNIDTSTPDYFNMFHYEQGKTIWNSRAYVSPSPAREYYFNFELKSSQPLTLFVDLLETDLKGVMFHLVRYEEGGNGFGNRMAIASPPVYISSGVARPDGTHGKIVLNTRALKEPGRYYIVVEGVSDTHWSDPVNGKIKFSLSTRPITTNISSYTSSNSATAVPTSILLTPNPANAMVELVVQSSAGSIGGSYQIVGVSGALKQKGNINGQRTTIDISKLIPGIYIVQAVVNGEVLSEKLIVK